MGRDRGTNYCYAGSHGIIYQCVHPPCCTPEMYTMLYVRYISKKSEWCVLESRAILNCFTVRDFQISCTECVPFAIKKLKKNRY